MTALESVDLLVPPGAVVGLVGPNGSGKTTALHVVAGLVRPDAGTAHVAGHPAGSLDARRSLALVPDEPGGLEELTVAEHVALVHRLHGAGDGARRRAAALAGAFGLDARRGVQLRALSRGQRRQASMIAALSLAPSLVLLDEAAATLDPEAVVVLREALAALAAEGTGVLLATQDLAFAERACTHVVLLAAGRAVEAGTVTEVLARHRGRTLEDAFLALLGELPTSRRLREALRAR